MAHRHMAWGMAGQAACGHLLPLRTPHAVRLCHGGHWTNVDQQVRVITHEPRLIHQGPLEKLKTMRDLKILSLKETRKLL